MYTGPHIIKDGLVFGYDTGYGIADNVTGTRFYRGEPVANMLNHGDNFNSWTKGRNSGSNPTVDVKVKEGPFKNTLADRLSLPSDGSYPRIYQVFTPASTATHTFSVWLKGETSGQGCFVGAFRNSPWSLPSSTSFSITDEWVNYSFNINPQDTSSMQLYIGSHNSHGGKSFLIYGAQLETGNTKSVFIDGTRSSTQSLIDLKGTTDIDVSNVSFDSTGQPDFDGSNDYINIGNPTSLQSLTTGTIEAVYYRDASTSTYQMIFTDGGSALEITYSGNTLQFYIGNSGISVTHAVVGEFFHVVGVWGSGYKKLYLNGSEVASGTNTGTNTGSTTRYIGGRGTNFPFNGKIPLVRVYTAALTAAEVKQNYNAYKNRFDI